MTNILVPSDFTASTLQLAEQAVKLLNREVNIILFHAFDLPFYTQDLIRTEKKPWQDLITDEFRQGCRQLKTQYAWHINNINFKFMQGNSNAIFRNWAEANEIHLVVCPTHYAYTKVHPRSLNPIPFFKKSGLPMLQEFKTARTTVLVKEPVRKIADYSSITGS